MPYVFVVGVKAPDGSMEQREFEVHHERVATMLKRILFDKTATQEEILEFAREAEQDQEMKSEFLEVMNRLSPGWTLQ